MDRTAYPRHHSGPPYTALSSSSFTALLSLCFPIAINRPSSVITSTLNPYLQIKVTTELSDAGVPHQQVSDDLGG